MGETLRVSGKSRPNAVAGAIAALLRSEGLLEVQAIGPAAVNQTVKALAIARGYLVADGLDLSAQPAFVKLEMEDEERTAVRFLVRREAVQVSEPTDLTALLPH
ncbi:stage V sporulation protein S [Deinococcus sp.]|uniref:stage V sporulation protein S n=1 Tax=Deinococcus sp. TaxID=47478 RepID=UPI0025D78FA4|nr:stage V sporulation protein S [Deinococcus sp.]